MLLKRKPFIHVNLSIKLNYVLVYIKQYIVHILGAFTACEGFGQYPDVGYVSPYQRCLDQQP